MKNFKALCMLFMAVIVTSSIPSDKKGINYYTLSHLKESGAPEKITLVITDNIGRGKPVISRGLLFTYKDRRAGRVMISGNFSSWRMTGMSRGKDGVWFYFLPEDKFSGKVQYKFNVDGLWTEDPNNVFRMDDRNGSFLSVAENDTPSEGKLVSFKFTGKNRIMFRVYKPAARIISLVGDFNGWNPEQDLLKRGNDGIWRLEKRIPKGIYRYKFIVDGDWQPDVFNPDSASDSTGDICSVIRMK